MTRALLLLFVLAIWSAEGQQRVYNVLDFHAAGDGKTDDAKVTVAQPHEFLIQVTAFAWLEFLSPSLSKRRSWRHGKRLAATGGASRSWPSPEKGCSC